jgi:hypothetical protein
MIARTLKAVVGTAQRYRVGKMDGATKEIFTIDNIDGHTS